MVNRLKDPAGHAEYARQRYWLKKGVALADIPPKQIRAPRPRRVQQPNRAEQIPEVELAWLAGLIEGEGHLGYSKKHEYLHALVRVNMTDEDVIRQAQAVAGGQVLGPYQPKNPKHKPIWTWLTTSQPAVNLMARLRPLLGKRRQARLDEVVRVALVERERALQSRKVTMETNRQMLERDPSTGRYLDKERRNGR